MSKQAAAKPTPKAPAAPTPSVAPSKDAFFKKLFLGLLGVLMILIPLFSKDAGINGDERFQTYIARYIIPFYTSFGTDKRVLLTRDEVMPVYKAGGLDSVKKQFNIETVPQENNLKNYGGGFEFFSSLIAKVFGYQNDEQMGWHTVRHALLGIITVLIMLFAGLIAKELLGWRAAFITVVLLAISPRFIGDGMMNNKDIPFAFGYVVALYFIVKFLKQLPFPTPRITVGVMLGFAAALNIRVGGLLLILYFGMFCLLFWFYFQYYKKQFDFNNTNLRNSILKAFAAAFLGYFLGLVFWPYGLISPISNPLAVLKEQSQFPVFINQLFEGKVVSSKDLPTYYLVKFIYMTTPIMVLLGILVSAVTVFLNRSRISLGLVGVMFFVIAFPLYYISDQHSNVYNGWRHVMFVYPPLVVLVALGYDLLIDQLKNKALKIGAVVLMVLLSLPSVIWIVGQHPYEYTYYNELEGGIKDAYGQYVTDYWMMSIRGGTEWLVKNEISKHQGNDKVVVATDCVYPLDIYLKNSPVKDKVQPLYVRYYDRNNKDWDYAVFYSEYVTPYQLQKGLWPPDGTIYQVKAGGVPLCAVVKRTSKSDFIGHEALQANDFAKAIEELEKAKVAYPKNEGVYTDLGLAYLQTKNMQKGIEALEQSTKLNNDNPMVYYYLGIAYAQASPPNFEYTEKYMRMALKINPGFQQAQDVLNQISGGQQTQQRKGPF